MKEKKIARKMRERMLYIPATWTEINPGYASEATHVAICVEGEHIGVYYANCEASELTQEQITEIETHMTTHGCEEISVYGLIDEEIMGNTQIRNLYGAKLIRNGKEMSDND